MSNQQFRIMNYLFYNGSITPAEAYEKLGVMKLSKRIGELIRNGHRIRKEYVAGENRYGEKVRYMKYYYGGDPQGESNGSVKAGESETN